jgi:hypothetical protein
MHWAFAGTALPSLPADFWTAFPADSADTSTWHPSPAQAVSNLAYSGASVAGSVGDAAQILSFDFDAPAIDPMAANPRHYCVFVVLDSTQDPVDESNLVPDIVTPNNNNVTHRNLTLQDSTEGDSFTDGLFVRNPFRRPLRTELVVEAPRGWKVEIEGIDRGQTFVLEPGSEKLLRYRIHPPRPGARGKVSFVQYAVSEKDRRVIGGYTVAFAPRERYRQEREPDEKERKPVEQGEGKGGH